MFTLEPTSVAVIGASNEDGKLGHEIFNNLLTQGYRGKAYPVNAKHHEIMGKKSYKSVLEIPGELDMAVVVTPAATVLDLAKECGKKKVKTLVVISAGFGETGTAEGKKNEAELKSIAEKYEMALVGPNCLGILRPSIGLNASFALSGGQPGNVALISQSGALAVALLDTSPELGLAYSFIASIGNKAAMDECDYVEICANDKKTTVIGLYLESINDGKRFIDVASKVSMTKPIVLIKSGTSSLGARAVNSHTGALAGSDAGIDAACEAGGIHRARSTREFLDLLRTLGSEPTLPSRNIAVITNAGGPGVLATDAAERAGLQLPELEAKIAEKLKAALPAAASVHNPIDVLGDALEDRYQAALTACAQDPSIDGVAVLLTPQVMTPSLKVAKVIAKAMKAYPLMPVVAAFMGGKAVESAKHELAKAGIPFFETPEDAVQALAALRAPNAVNATLIPRDRRVDVASTRLADATDDQARALLKGKRGLLSEALTEDLLEMYGLPVPDQALAASAKQAIELADQIGYPVVAKVSSPDILHKTEIGGVRANLKTAKEVEKAYNEILENCKKHMPAAGISGVLIQKFLPAGYEFIVGAIKDPSFGALVMVGLGGIYTELFKDSVFRVAPIDEKEAYEMLSELKSWKLLTGLRGKVAVDIPALAKAIAAVSQLASDCPRIAELDLNPVLVSEKGIVIADAKVVVD